MRCDVITLFPDMIRAALGESILKRAQIRGLLHVQIHQLRDFTVDKHRMTDDVPYGGGGGMLLKPEPIFAAVEKIKSLRDGDVRIIMPSPQGRVFTQKMAEDFSQDARSLVFICGHYEGIDARVTQGIEIEEVSLGDYILTGGELPAVTMIDAAARLLPGVLGGATSALDESFEASLLEYPHYTRPSEFRGMQVPEVLLSGNHAAIRDWRRASAIRNTQQKRPDLLLRAVLSPDEKQRLSLGSCLMEE